MAKNRMTTPKGRAVYPHLHTPDTKFDEAGVYKLGLAIPTAEAAPLIEKLEALAQQAIATAKKENPKEKKIKPADLPWTEDEETGETTFNFKMKASGVNKQTQETWSRKPALFDGRGAPLGKDAKVGGGSVCRVSFEPAGFYTKLIGAGISLRLEAVQVIELREFGGGSASSYGFEAEEFETSEKDEPANDNTETEDQPDQAADGSDF